MTLMAHGESSSTEEHDHSAHARIESENPDSERATAPSRKKGDRAGGNQRQAKNRGSTARNKAAASDRAPAVPSGTRGPCTSAGPCGKLRRAPGDAASARSQRVDHGGDSLDRQGLNDLVELAKGGDRNALEGAIQIIKCLVLRICLDHLRRKDSAEDAAQTVFLNIAQGIGAQKHNSSFTSWVSTIANNVCRDILRNGRREVRIDSAFENPVTESDEFDFEVKPQSQVNTILASRWAQQQVVLESQRQYQLALSSNPSLQSQRAEIVNAWQHILNADKLRSTDWVSYAKTLHKEVEAIKQARNRFRKTTRAHLIDRVMNGAEQTLQSESFSAQYNLVGLFQNSDEYRQIIAAVRACAVNYDFLRDDVAGGPESPDPIATSKADRWLSQRGLTTTTLVELLCIRQFHRILDEEIARADTG